MLVCFSGFLFVCLFVCLFLFLFFCFFCQVRNKKRQRQWIVTSVQIIRTAKSAKWWPLCLSSSSKLAENASKQLTSVAAHFLSNFCRQSNRESIARMFWQDIFFSTSTFFRRGGSPLETWSLIFSCFMTIMRVFHSRNKNQENETTTTTKRNGTHTEKLKTCKRRWAAHWPLG